MPSERLPDDPFLQRLGGYEPDQSPPEADDAVAAGSRGRSAPAPAAASGEISFWNSPAATAAIHRRITGREETRPEERFAEIVRELRGGPLRAGISLRAGDAELEARLLDLGACEGIVGIDDDARRIEIANSRVPDRLRDRLSFVEGELGSHRPPEPVDLIVARSALHRVELLDRRCEVLATLLEPGGLVYLDEFIGPARHQWTDRQVDVVNRLLAVLPRELKQDLTRSDGTIKDLIGRPNLERFLREHPDEAVSSPEIPRALDRHFERIEFVPYGGAVFHQLFSRIMGNFEPRPELIDLIVELDAILTEEGVVDADYLWAVYRAA